MPKPDGGKSETQPWVCAQKPERFDQAGGVHRGCKADTSTSRRQHFEAQALFMNTGHSQLSDISQQAVVDLRTDAEKILQRAQQLPEPDRTVVTMYLQNANSFRQIAQLTGLSEATVARHIREILTTLSDEKLHTVLTSSRFLSRRQRKIVRDYFFGGLTVSSIARKYRMSYYNARRIISIVRKITQQNKYKTTVRNY